MNEDNSHFFSTRGERRISIEDLIVWVDQYADTQIKDLLLCVNSMSTSYNSEAGSPVWEGYNPDGPDDQQLFASLPPEKRKRSRRWVHAAWDLAARGIDPYSVWIDRCREKGITPWISVRMNDVHDVDDERSFMHSAFWKEHPEYRRINYTFTDWTDRALDYRHQEVRDYQLGIIKEIINRYNFDGLELDWMRFGYHFAPGYEEIGKSQLNRFVEDVKDALTQKESHRDHTLKLSVRVPSHPDTALGLGFDVPRWAKDGLIDSIVITPFWWSIETDMPMEIWRYLLNGTSVSISAGLELLIRPYPSYTPLQKNNLETVRGAASSLLSRGADSIYLFNYMDSETSMENDEEYRQLLQEVGNLETLSGKDRRHPVTFTDVWIPGTPKGYMLPTEVQENVFKDFRIHIGRIEDKLNWYIMIGTEIDKGSKLQVRLNGNKVTRSRPIPIKDPIPREMHFFKADPSIIHHGFNTVTVTSESPVKIHWVELLYRNDYKDSAGHKD